MASILADMGKAVSDGQVVDAPAKAPETARNVPSGEFISMGEHARFKKEQAEAAKAAKPADDKPAGDPPKPDEAKAGDAKADDKAAPTAKDPAAPPSDPPPAKPKVIVEKAKPIEDIVEGIVRRVAKETPAAPPAPEKKEEAPAAADPDADFVESLGESEKEAIELARYAAKAMPDKYGTMAKKTLDYLKKVDSYIDEKRKEDSDWDPDTDENFAAFIEENQPIYQSGDRKKLERQWIADQVRQDVEKEFKPKMEATEHAERMRELKPEIDKSVNSYRATVAQRFVPDDKSPFHEVFKAAEEKDPTFGGKEAWDAAATIDPLAASVAKNFLGQAETLGREYLELVGGERQAAYDQKLPASAPSNQKALRQQNLFSFIDQQEQIFARDGGEMRVVNGRSFVTRRELEKMPAPEQARHWTLGHEDVLDMLAVAAATQAKTVLAAEIKRREDEGYVRPAKAVAAKKEAPAAKPAAKKEESPKTTITPAPGAANLPPPVSSPTVFTEDELKRQWSGGASAWAG
jgi:hypothetical protein